MNFHVQLFVVLRVFSEIGDTLRDLVVSDPEITEEEGIGEGTGREERRGREKRWETLEESRRFRRKCGAARRKRK
jgi:hypothetical protein